jgi:hypothetical protein
MSQLNSFMDGLSDARRESERDTRLAMDIEGKRAALAQQMAQESRASERLQMDRDRAIRETRDSDFAYEQKQSAAAREQQYAADMKAWSQKYLAPRKEVGPDGQERTAPPRQTSFDGQFGMYAEWAHTRAKHGLMKPEELKQFREFYKEAEQDGLVGAVLKARTGDSSGLKEVLGRYGVNPQNVKMETVVDPKTRLATTKLTGVGESGQPFDFDFTPLFTAIGLNMDPDKAANDRARVGSQIEQAQATAQSQRDRGTAALRTADSRVRYNDARAREISGQGSGSGGAVGFNEQESRAFQTALNQSKPMAPKVASQLGAPTMDEPGREFLRDAALAYFRREVSKPGGARPSIQQTMSAAQSALATVNDETLKILPSARFVIDPTTKSPRLVAGDAQGAVTIDRVPREQRLSAFDQVRRSYIEQKRQEAAARRQAEDAQTRRKAINTADDSEDE